MSAPSPSPAASAPSTAATPRPGPGDVAGLVGLQLGVSILGAAILSLLGSESTAGFAGVGILVGAQGWAGINAKRSLGSCPVAFRARLALLAASIHSLLGGLALVALLAMGDMTDLSGSARSAIVVSAVVFAFALAYGLTRWGLRMGTPRARR